MQFGKICFIITILLMFSSAAYLLYLNLTLDLNQTFRIRFFTFIGQHLFSLFMLITRKCLHYADQPHHHLQWAVNFTGINFLLFGAVQIFELIHSDQDMVEFTNRNVVKQPLPILTYYHLYYQFNIYMGIFFMFSLIMAAIYYIHERDNRQRFELVVQYLQPNLQRASGNEDQLCPICLASYQKNENMYKLNCTHHFHERCLMDWLKQKLSCPMCRDDLGRHIQQLQNMHQINFQMREFH